MRAQKGGWWLQVWQVSPPLPLCRAEIRGEVGEGRAGGTCLKGSSVGWLVCGRIQGRLLSCPVRGFAQSSDSIWGDRLSDRRTRGRLGGELSHSWLGGASPAARQEAARTWRVDSAAGADGSRPQMVEFIKQEANEKAHEILIKVHSMPGR